ncbi:MAG TPA: glycosyltransferase family 4 protein [Pyrinomonadaceae bacterium]|nr:glycosyltransferase family 4 protein [Pyrinomonadaceae bacterium]
MTRIAILTPSVTTGDAVSNDVLGMYDVLKGRGYDVRVFAEGWALDKPRVWPAPQVEGFLKKSTDILIYHYSRGWDPGLDLLHELKCRKIIKYHNVTPPDFLANYSSDFAAMCLEGRQQLVPIARSACDLYLSDSAYNMRELVAEGAVESKSFVVPPFHHVDRLHSIEPDESVLNSCSDGKINVLMVGRVAPNKAHPALIEAFAAYHHDYNPNSRLIIVGKEEVRLAKYSTLLRGMVKRLKLQENVIFTCEVSDRALKAYYAAAHVFMITSEHEGFCVPLVEAMAMKVPIVAYSATAIPETVGSAGLIWEERNPYLLAESVNSIISDNSLGKGLSTLGWRRYQELFTNEQIEHRFLDALGSPL